MSEKHIVHTTGGILCDSLERAEQERLDMCSRYNSEPDSKRYSVYIRQTGTRYLIAIDKANITSDDIYHQEGEYVYAGNQKLLIIGMKYDSMHRIESITLYDAGKDEIRQVKNLHAFQSCYYEMTIPDKNPAAQIRRICRHTGQLLLQNPKSLHFAAGFSLTSAAILNVCKYFVERIISTEHTDTVFYGITYFSLLFGIMLIAVILYKTVNAVSEIRSTNKAEKQNNP